EGQEVGLLFKGNGPIGTIYAEASFDGSVRGYCPNPGYQAPDQADVLNLSKAMGFGTLTVARHQPFQRQPFNGTVEMVSGEIGDDLAHYLHQSHQIRSIVSVGVYLDTFGQVKSAAGVIIEVMPGVEDEVIDKIQKNIETHQVSVSKTILNGGTPEDLVTPYLEGIPFTRLSHDYPMRYFCPCTIDRVKRALTTLGVNGLQEMVDENKPSDITCEVCGRKYQVSIEELSELRDQLRKSQMH
ncbi:MAG: Hsp33 family molecular chaperone HslO, partial [Bdellovibrio sp.]